MGPVRAEESTCRHSSRLNHMLGATGPEVGVQQTLARRQKVQVTGAQLVLIVKVENVPAYCPVVVS